MPGCRLLLPPSLRHSNRTDSATNTAASWPPANKDSFRALLYNSTAELGAPISFVKQSVQSGQEFFSSFAPCPAHRLGLTSSSAYTYLYYTTPTVFGSFFCAVFPQNRHFNVYMPKNSILCHRRVSYRVWCILMTSNQKERLTKNEWWRWKRDGAKRV